MDVVFEFWPISARIRCRFRPGHRFRPVSGGQSIFYLHFGSFCFEHFRDVPSSCFSFSGGLGISPQTGAGGEGMGKSLRWYDKFALLHNQDRLPIRIDGREGSWEGGAAGFFSPRGKVPACPGQFIFFKTVLRHKQRPSICVRGLDHHIRSFDRI